MENTALITIATVEKLCAERGLTILPQKSWYKVYHEGKALYFSRTKRGITKIHVSGFNMFHPAVRPLKKKNGKVTGEVFGTSENALEAIVLGLDTVARKDIKGTKLS